MNPSSPITPLTSGQINHDHLSVELVEPAGMPAVVRIVWPTAPTITTTAPLQRSGQHSHAPTR